MAGRENSQNEIVSGVIVNTRFADFCDDGHCRRNWGISLFRTSGVLNAGTTIDDIEDIVSKVSAQRAESEEPFLTEKGTSTTTTCSTAKTCAASRESHQQSSGEKLAVAPGSCSVCGDPIPDNEPFHETYCSPKSKYPPSAYDDDPVHDHRRDAVAEVQR